MESLEKKIKKVLKQESSRNFSEDLSRKLNKYETLEKRGFIKNDSYSVRRVDTIGYSRYGHTL